MSGIQNRIIMGIFMLLLLFTPTGSALAETVSGPQTGEEALIMGFERLDEWRTWEIRRELHRIHHHLEYMPIMVFTHVGILLVLIGIFILQILSFMNARRKPNS